MGQPNAVDQQFLMTCHLQAVWGALPLRFMTYVVVTTGTTLGSTPDKLQVVAYSFWLHPFFSLTGSLQTFKAYLYYYKKYPGSLKSYSSKNTAVFCLM